MKWIPSEVLLYMVYLYLFSELSKLIDISSRDQIGIGEITL